MQCEDVNNAGRELESRAEEEEEGNSVDVNMTDDHPACVSLFIEYVATRLQGHLTPGCNEKMKRRIDLVAKGVKGRVE